MSLSHTTKPESLPSTDFRPHDVFDVIVIGAGPAGLSIGYELKRCGIRFLLIERGEGAGESWRRMPVNLKLVTPWKANYLSGTHPGLFPRHYEMSREEFCQYLRDYAVEHKLPVQAGEAVSQILRDPDGLFRVLTSTSSYTGRILVNATGNSSTPFIPRYDGAESSPILQLHVADYRDPEQLRALIGERPGPVLIVGKRLSAGQTMVELVDAGFDVALSHRSKITYGGGPFSSWFFYRMMLEIEALKIFLLGQTACGLEVPMQGGRARKLIRSGQVRTFPGLNRFQGASLLFKDGSRLKPAAVLYATGFRPSLNHLHALLADVPDRHRLPSLKGMESVTVPGLFFLGLENQRNMQSHYLRGIRSDALCLAEELKSRLERRS